MGPTRSGYCVSWVKLPILTPGAASKGFPLRKETEVIVVPARPFFEPAVTELEAEMSDILEDASKKVFK